MQVLLTENIRQFRRARQMTQEQLAEVLGVTVGTVCKWESGVHLDKDTTSIPR